MYISFFYTRAPYIYIIHYILRSCVDFACNSFCTFRITAHNIQGNRIKICNFAQVVAYMCYLKMHKTIFSLCFSCHYNF